MAGTYDNIVGRADLTDALVPDEVTNDIIKEAAQASFLLTNARNVRMTSKKYKQPVLATLPEAYWVDGDTGMKQTTKTTFKDVVMTAEELAVIVPIPDSLVSDSNVPLWAEISPLLAEAIGKKVDLAGIFGVDKPDSWPDDIVAAATKANNTVTRSESTDLAQDVATLGKMLAEQGFGITGFGSKPGIQWELVGTRDATGRPIYTPSLSAGAPSGLYGYPMREVMNGAWDTTKAELIAADWTKFVVGIRQDITFDVFREGVISDENGKVLLNLMQQDTTALRVVFRVGFQTAVPVTRVGKGKTIYPAGLIIPASE